MSSVHVSTASIQDHATPPVFLGAVQRQFGCRLILDLAALPENRKCDRFFSPEFDSLRQDWKKTLDTDVDEWVEEDRAAWLNPVFRGVDPWMEKCKTEAAKGCRIVSLTLASLGTGWYRDHVEGQGLTMVLRKRMVFMGQKDPFPKELMLTLWGFGLTGFGFWDPPAWAMRQDLEGERAIFDRRGQGWTENLSGIGDGLNHPKGEAAATKGAEQELWPLEGAPSSAQGKG